MQSIALAQTGRSTTRLGFGCSSVMGGLGRTESLMMLEAAFEAGIRHFDVAPMYGFGEAEGCLGEFLVRHPGQVTVTTKYGIPAEPKQAFKSFLRGVARPIVRHVPGIKRGLAVAGSGMSNTGSDAAPKAAFSSAEARASLEHSLSQLRTDHVDLWLMHEASAVDLCDDGLLRLLEGVVKEGKVGGFGVGSTRAKIPTLLAERPAYCGILQYEWSVLNPVLADGALFRLHHRALVHNFTSLYSALVAQPATCRAWSERIGADLSKAEILAQLMLKASLVMNPESILLFSSKQPKHIRQNVRVAEDASLEAKARELYGLVQAEVAQCDTSELLIRSGVAG